MSDLPRGPVEKVKTHKPDLSVPSEKAPSALGEIYLVGLVIKKNPLKGPPSSFRFFYPRTQTDTSQWVSLKENRKTRWSEKVSRRGRTKGQGGTRVGQTTHLLLKREEKRGSK